MIAAIIRNVIRFRWVVLVHHGGAGRRERLCAPHGAARRHSRHLRPADHRLHRSGRAARWSSKPKSPSRSSGRWPARRTSSRSAAPRTWGTRSSTSSCENAGTPGGRSPVRRRSAERDPDRSCPPTRTSSIGPNASSIGWIFQYALVDQAGHPRPARAAAAEREHGQARAAVGRRRRRSRVGRRAREAVSGEAVSAAARASEASRSRRCWRRFRARFRRPAAARSRSPTANTSCAASVNSDDLDKLEFLVLGRDRAGQAVQLQRRRLPAGRLRPAARHRGSRRQPARSSAASPSWSRDATSWR